MNLKLFLLIFFGLSVFVVADDTVPQCPSGTVFDISLSMLTPDANTYACPLDDVKIQTDNMNGSSDIVCCKHVITNTTCPSGYYEVGRQKFSINDPGVHPGPTDDFGNGGIGYPVYIDDSFSCNPPDKRLAGTDHGDDNTPYRINLCCRAGSAETMCSYYGLYPLSSLVLPPGVYTDAWFMSTCQYPNIIIPKLLFTPVDPYGDFLMQTQLICCGGI